MGYSVCFTPLTPLRLLTSPRDDHRDPSELAYGHYPCEFNVHLPCVETQEVRRACALARMGPKATPFVASASKAFR